jgi:hypothetical protein
MNLELGNCNGIHEELEWKVCELFLGKFPIKKKMSK